MNSLFFKNVRKIALLRASALGDLIVTLPAIQAIRNAYPKAEIVLLGKPWHFNFLEQKRTPIDRVIVVPPMEGIGEEKELADPTVVDRFFNAMQEERFDIAIHFHGKGIAANSFLKRLGARLTAGLTCPEAEALDRSIPYYYYQSEVMRYLEVASLIGGHAGNISPEVRVTLQDQEESGDFLVQHGVIDPYIILHSCALDIRRMWPLKKFAVLGDKLYQTGFPIIFTGSEADHAKVQSIIDQMQSPAINACGLLSLGGLAGLLSQSTLVVASDTGPLHLARAVGAKTVGLYWAPNLINWGPISRTKHRPVVSWIMECPNCGTIPNDPFPFEPQLPTCKHEYSFVKNIKVGKVVEAALLLLKEGSSGSKSQDRINQNQIGTNPIEIL